MSFYKDRPFFIIKKTLVFQKKFINLIGFASPNFEYLYHFIKGIKIKWALTFYRERCYIIFLYLKSICNGSQFPIYNL